MYINCLPSYSHIHFITKTKSVITKDFLKYAKRKSMFDFLPNKLSIKQLSWHVSIIQTYLMIKKHKVSICHWSHAFMHNLRFPLRFSFFSMSTSHKWFHLKRVLTTTIPPSYLNFLPLTLLIYNVKQKNKKTQHIRGQADIIVVFLDILQYSQSDEFSKTEGQTLSGSCVAKTKYRGETGWSFIGIFWPWSSTAEI